MRQQVFDSGTRVSVDNRSAVISVTEALQYYFLPFLE